MFAATIAGGMAMSIGDLMKVQMGPSVVVLPLLNLAEVKKGDPSSKKVIIAGKNALNLSSAIAQTKTLPPPNLIGGVISGVFDGQCRNICGSMKVIIEGQPAIRLNDPDMQDTNNFIGSIKVPSQTKVMIMS